MNEETHIDEKVSYMLFKLGVSNFNVENTKIAYELVDYLRNGIMNLEQTQSSRQDWSIAVEDIKKYLCINSN